VRVAWNFFTAAYNIPLATTSDYPHSLTAGAIAAASGSPLLFTGTRLLENSAARYIDANSGSVEYVEVFGRPTVLSQKIFDQAVTLAGGRRPAL
jgi:hypothetical protein